MATVTVRLSSDTSSGVTVDMEYDDVSLDVGNFRVANPQGRQSRLVVRNAVGGERIRQVPLTPPDFRITEPAPAALVMLSTINYHGVPVLGLPAGCTISTDVR